MNSDGDQRVVDVGLTGFGFAGVGVVGALVVLEAGFPLGAVAVPLTVPGATPAPVVTVPPAPAGAGAALWAMTAPLERTRAERPKRG